MCVPKLWYNMYVLCRSVLRHEGEREGGSNIKALCSILVDSKHEITVPCNLRHVSWTVSVKSHMQTHTDMIDMRCLSYSIRKGYIAVPKHVCIWHRYLSYQACLSTSEASPKNMFFLTLQLHSQVKHVELVSSCEWQSALISACSHTKTYNIQSLNMH